MGNPDLNRAPTVVKMMDLSTKCIPLHTAKALGMTEIESLSSPLVSIVAHTPWASYGWIIACTDDAVLQLKPRHPELSALMTFCLSKGITYLKLDRDGPDGLDEWPVFDW